MTPKCMNELYDTKAILPLYGDNIHTDTTIKIQTHKHSIRRYRQTDLQTNVLKRIFTNRDLFLQILQKDQMKKK